jgi:hypothetical protein
MKVIVNETMRVEIDLPAGDVTFEDFKLLVKKLNVVVSTFSGDTSAKQISHGKKPFVQRNRSDIISLMKDTLALGPYPEETKLDEVLQKHSVGKSVYNQFKWRWLEKYQITPQEVGLTEFPAKAPGRPKVN